jgi:hypothetical protein
MYPLAEHQGGIVGFNVAYKLGSPNCLKGFYQVSLKRSFSVAEHHVQAILTAYCSYSLWNKVIVKISLAASCRSAFDIPTMVAAFPKLLLLIAQTI